MDELRLAGGSDGGAFLSAGKVRRVAGPWTGSVHLLLRHLETRGFAGAPRALGVDEQGREVLTYLPGETVGDRRPWPAWVHSDVALVDVAHWLRDYHRAVADFEPPAEATWREGARWQPGLVVAHGDTAPYNAVWHDGHLVGFVDWDMAAPMTPEADLAWVAFSWVPLHAAHVVAAEGFTDLAGRRGRLQRFLDEYGWPGSTEDVLDLVAARLEDQLRVMRATAASGDPAYRQMLDLGRDRDLEVALRELRDL